MRVLTLYILPFFSHRAEYLSFSSNHKSSTTKIHLIAPFKATYLNSSSLGLILEMIGVESGGAIIGIVDIAVRVGLRLARFLHDVNEAEEARSTLYTRVAELDRIVNSVRTIVQTRDQDTQKPISDDEYAIRLTLLRAISRCEGTVQRFEQQIAQLGNIERRSRWWRSVALQIRLDVHENTLARTDKDIQADIAALQLLYMCFLP